MYSYSSQSSLPDVKHYLTDFIRSTQQGDEDELLLSFLTPRPSSPTFGQEIQDMLTFKLQKYSTCQNKLLQ